MEKRTQVFQKRKMDASTQPKKKGSGVRAVRRGPRGGGSPVPSPALPTKDAVRPRGNNRFGLVAPARAAGTRTSLRAGRPRRLFRCAWAARGSTLAASLVGSGFGGRGRQPSERGGLAASVDKVARDGVEAASQSPAFDAASRCGRRPPPSDTLGSRTG